MILWLRLLSNDQNALNGVMAPKIDMVDEWNGHDWRRKRKEKSNGSPKLFFKEFRQSYLAHFQAWIITRTVLFIFYDEKTKIKYKVSSTFHAWNLRGKWKSIFIEANIETIFSDFCSSIQLLNIFYIFLFDARGWRLYFPVICTKVTRLQYNK